MIPLRKNRKRSTKAKPTLQTLKFKKKHRHEAKN